MPVNKSLTEQERVAISALGLNVTRLGANTVTSLSKEVKAVGGGFDWSNAEPLFNSLSLAGKAITNHFLWAICGYSFLSIINDSDNTKDETSSFVLDIISSDTGDIYNETSIFLENLFSHPDFEREIADVFIATIMGRFSILTFANNAIPTYVLLHNR
jgi:hypothetical protein